MAGISTQHGVRLARGMAVAGLLALSLLVLPAAAEAGKDTAKYDYEVTNFDYEATGDLTASRYAPFGVRCEVGRTAAWTGHVQTGPSLGTSGDGSLKVGERGTFGTLLAQTDVQSNFGPAEHTIATQCCPPESLECAFGQTLDSTTTDCTDGPVDSKVAGAAIIKGGVGDRVKVKWVFVLRGVDGDWVPDTFTCVEQFTFPFDRCTSQAKLSSLTKKKFTLPFRCLAQTFTPPPGDYDLYSSRSDVSGSFELKRTKQS